MPVIASILYIVLWLFLLAMLARLVADWVQIFARRWEPKGLLLIVLEAVYTVTDPPLRAIRRIIPPLRLGSVAIDLAFIVLIILVQIALTIVAAWR